MSVQTFRVLVYLIFYTVLARMESLHGPKMHDETIAVSVYFELTLSSNSDRCPIGLTRPWGRCLVFALLACL